MDRELVVRAQQGDEAAFGAIARVAYPRHLQVAYRILRHPQAAEDATQQAWIRTWRTLPRLREPERFDAWSYRILVNACLSESKRLRRWGPTLTGNDRRTSPDPTVLLAEQDELEGAFVHLSVDQRVVIVLHFYLGLTLPEIASTLEVPVGTVNSRLGRALERLRRELGIIDLRPREQGQEATS